MAMSQQGSFVGGFLLGTLIGAALGGVVGALSASRRPAPRPSGKSLGAGLDEGNLLLRDKFKASGEDSMEAARLGLEAKIAQLNEAIDEVRQQLGGVTATSEFAPGKPPPG
jgi:gas vesicle protein